MLRAGNGRPKQLGWGSGASCPWLGTAGELGETQSRVGPPLSPCMAPQLRHLGIHLKVVQDARKELEKGKSPKADSLPESAKTTPSERELVLVLPTFQGPKVLAVGSQRGSNNLDRYGIQ